jgi:hypothetical protein
MLHLPQRVTARLETVSGEPFRRADVLFGVHAAAQLKNDYWLGPYPTDENGVARISRDDLLADIEATHDSGLMDYAGIGTCAPVVEIMIWTAEGIRKALTARRETWRSLLKGEDRRWKSLAELIGLYERALSVLDDTWQPTMTTRQSAWSIPDLAADLVFVVTERKA